MLIAGGDSWSCWPQEQMYGSRDKCWPAIVSKKLGVKLIDHSKAGCSNDRIFRYCLPSVLECSNNSIAVIFWSSSDRFEIGFKGKIEQVMPGIETNVVNKEFIIDNLNLYLQHCNTILYSLSIQEACKKQKIKLLQKFCSKHDCWWNNTLESFKEFLIEAKLLDYLSDEQIYEKYLYLEKIYSLLDRDCWINNINEPLSNLIETSEEFKWHPTNFGQLQMSNLILEKL